MFNEATVQAETPSYRENEESSDPALKLIQHQNNEDPGQGINNIDDLISRGTFKTQKKNSHW